jgi:hypothetical protein
VLAMQSVPFNWSVLTAKKKKKKKKRKKTPKTKTHLASTKSLCKQEEQFAIFE